MSDPEIPSDLRNFILETIDSVGQVEAILLCRANPNEEWCPELVAARLYISEKDAASLLAQLSSLNMLERLEGEPPRYRYRTASPELSALIDQLAATYAKHLISVTKLIHTKPKTRIQQFADAFRIRKDEP